MPLALAFLASLGKESGRSLAVFVDAALLVMHGLRFDIVGGELRGGVEKDSLEGGEREGVSSPHF
jgi:hypothetical protein